MPVLVKLKQREEMAGLADALRGVLKGDFVIGLVPLALKTPDRLYKSKGPLILVTADLDDPLPAWRLTKEGRRLGEKVSGWRSLASLAEHAAVSKAIEPRRTSLPTALALQSPRLAPALAALVPALGGGRQNQMNWTFSLENELCATLYAHNELLSEGLRLRVTWDGLERWPALKGPTPVGGKYPITWLLDAETALDVAKALV
jgi:hypothetical protein